MRISHLDADGALPRPTLRNEFLNGKTLRRVDARVSSGYLQDQQRVHAVLPAAFHRNLQNQELSSGRYELFQSAPERNVKHEFHEFKNDVVCCESGHLVIRLVEAVITLK